jgi:hypothetical protein
MVSAVGLLSVMLLLILIRLLTVELVLTSVESGR